MSDDVTSKQVILFCGEKLRPLANILWEACFKARAFLEDYKVAGIDDILAKTADDSIVADGSDQDGRNRISAADIRNTRKLLIEFSDFMDDEVQTGISRLDAIAKSHTNTL